MGNRQTQDASSSIVFRCSEGVPSSIPGGLVLQEVPEDDAPPSLGRIEVGVLDSTRTSLRGRILVDAPGNHCFEERMEGLRPYNLVLAVVRNSLRIREQREIRMY